MFKKERNKTKEETGSSPTEDTVLNNVESAADKNSAKTKAAEEYVPKRRAAVPVSETPSEYRGKRVAKVPNDSKNNSQQTNSASVEEASQNEEYIPKRRANAKVDSTTAFVKEPTAVKDSEPLLSTDEGTAAQETEELLGSKPMENNRNTKKIATIIGFVSLLILSLLLVTLFPNLLKFGEKKVDKQKPAFPVASKTVEYGQTDEQICEPFKVKKISCSVVWDISETLPVGELINQENKEGPSKTKTSTKSTFIHYSKGPSIVKTPILSGLTVDEAKKTLWASGLALGNETQVDANRNAGTITQSSVQPASQLPNGTSIDVNVSTGQFSLPNWVGKTKEFVTADANTLGIKVEFTDKNDPGPIGVVLAQDPVTEKVNFGTIVKIVVSSKDAKTSAIVPDVVGQDSTAAISNLAAAGFLKIKSVITVNPAATADKIISMDPKPGSNVSTVDTITLHVERKN